MDSLTSEEGGEIENVDAIKKFIEAQEKEIQDQRLVDLKSGNKSSDVSDSNRPSQEETSSVCSSVIEMVINESELEIARKGHDKSKDSFSPADKGCGSMSLSVGSKVEAKDFSEDWHPAEIIEVDYDDMEVLVHYEHDKKRSDEWINVSSPRLRPLSYSTASSTTTTVLPGPSSEDSLTDSIPIANLREDAKESKLKLEEKEKLCFQVGERCLARWRDNRRFVATVLKDLGDGKYEILFDDGCHWTCNTSRLYKLRSKKSIASAALVSPSPFNSGPSTSNSNSQYPTFHTHLFDPTRDYLGSKSERREMKRKLNIKEIFNIGQKKARKQKSPKENTPKSVERKPRNIKKRIKLKLKSEVKFEPKSELPAVDAVASIIGTIQQEEPEKVEPIVDEVKPEVTIDKKEEEVKDISLDVKEVPLIEPEANEDLIELEDLKVDWKDPVLEEEVMLEQFEKPDDSQHEEVLDRIKEVINKLEDGIQQAEKTGSPKPEPKEEIISPPAPEEPKPEPVKTEVKEVQTNTDNAETSEKDKTKKLSKVKKGKKLKLLREKKVKIQVEKVRNELEMMKKQMSEMRKQMLTNRRGFNDREARRELPESFMLPGEWCCRWVNGQPVGTVSEIEAETKPPNEGTGKPPLPRRSVQVEDKRLPEGWTKHMVRRSFGHSAGKWDVVLISPDNRRFHTKNEVRTYLDNNPALNLEEFSHALTDFGVHLKLSRRMGWISYTPDGTAEGPASPLPAGTLSSTSPLVKRKKLTLRKEAKPKKKKPKQERISLPRTDVLQMESVVPSPVAASSIDDSSTSVDTTVDVPPLEDGYVFVGSLKVQVIDNLLRCPADNCFKNFRNNTLLQMHIKHYHRELKKMMGATPKVLDLAYARTMPLTVETPPRAREDKIIKVKIPRPPKREEPKPEVKEIVHDLKVDTTVHSPVREPESIPPIPKSQDSPKLRQALINKPVKRPKVLLPVRRPDPDPTIPDSVIEEMVFESKLSMESPSGFSPLQSTIDFDSSISSHTVTKPLSDKKRKVEKKKKTFAFAPKMAMSEEDDWSGINSDLETRSSFPRSETPEKYDTKPLALQDTLEEPKPSATRYMYENGERIKLVRMKREEIINCHCGFREEDGLMVQCELCLCWQHALCHNIQRESEVPEKYTCSICVNPRRGRRSMRFVHQQARLFDGQLAGARPCDTLRRSHELAGNLLRVQDALHALRVKYYVATKKDHPKLYLWAEDWEKAEIQYTQEKLNSDYSDLNIVINSVDKENLPVKHEEVKDTLHSEEHEQDRYMQRDNAMGSQALLSSLMSSPGAESLDLPISTSELERLAKSVQEQEVQRTTTAPEPEAAIENSVCRERLLKHVQRCQALIDARLESIEAQVAELESQSPSLEDDETAEHFPRTKQTIQMLMRDLETMEELGVIT